MPAKLSFSIGRRIAQGGGERQGVWPLEHSGGTVGGRRGASGAPKGTVGDPRETLGTLWVPLGGLLGHKMEERQTLSELAGGKSWFYDRKTYIFKGPQGRPRGGGATIIDEHMGRAFLLPGAPRAAP